MMPSHSGGQITTGVFAQIFIGVDKTAKHRAFAPETAGPPTTWAVHMAQME